MAKRKYSMSNDMNYKEYRDGTYYAGERHYEMPNSGRGLMREDMSKPCGLPMGAHVKAVDMSKGAETMSGRPKDLYELVEQTMHEDARDVKSMTKPRNF